MPSKKFLQLSLAGASVLAAATLAWTIRRRRRRAIAEQSDWNRIVGATDHQLVVQELLDIEMALLNRNEPPITTLTWFGGDYIKARSILERRLQLILNANPWLGGRIVKKLGKLYLVYQRDGKLHQQDFFQTIAPGESRIARDTPLDKLAGQTQNLMLQNGPAQPLLKVSLVPCRDHSHQHFALVVAVSHIAGDGHTFYKIHSMLCSRDDATIVSLVDRRITATEEQQIQLVGRDNYMFLAKPPVGLRVLWFCGFLRGLTIGPQNTSRMVLVDAPQMQLEKERAARNNEKVPFVSTNDILTSWFIQQTNCLFGAMVANLRNRLTGITDRHAGNYECAVLYSRADAASPCQIRQSLWHLDQSHSRAPLPGFWKLATAKTVAIVTNWSSFATPNDISSECHEELHLPLYDIRTSTPTTLAVLVIFRSGPRGLGLYMIGTPDKLAGVSRAPFFSTQTLC